ncbi:MAG: hypothetical protein IJT50_07910 [Lentisphaeria bacterium]|nr:hypothetical protein [Lentisphaeria bacterium]
MKRVRPPSEEEQKLKAEAGEMMVRDRALLIQCQPFIGSLAMHLELIPVFDGRMTTACTDCRRLFMDAEFYRRMNPEERLGVLGHEVWHCALRHFQRRGSRDRAKFNFAGDVEVDLLLRQAGFKVEILPYDPSWVGKSAEQIYDLMYPGLERFQKEDKHIYPEDLPKAGGKKGKPGSPGTQVPAESGEEGDEAENDGNSPGGGSPAAGESSRSGRGNASAQAGGAGSDVKLPRVEHPGVIDPDFRPEFDAEAADDWKDNLRNAVEREMKRGGKGIGNLPGNVEELIEDDDRNATVDWKRVLLDYVTQIFGGERQWLPPARRYVWKKLYLPSRARKKTIEIVLAIDTSGSTTEDLPDFLAELRGMANAFGEYKLTVIQCDMKIHSVKEYSNEDPLPETGLRFQGFGGTSFLAPFKYVKEKMPEAPTVFIYLTDGEGEAPEKAPDYPVIWCLTGEGHKPAEWGLEVRIGRKP